MINYPDADAHNKASDSLIENQNKVRTRKWFSMLQTRKCTFVTRVPTRST